MRDLTQEEEALVARSRKTTRPRYYSAATDQDLTISLDMETWLIITPLTARARFATWLQQLSGFAVHDTPMDQLAADFQEDELANATDQREALQGLFQPYDEFYGSLPLRGFEDLPELYALMEQTRVGLGRISETHDDSIFAFAMANAEQDAQETTDAEDSTGRQRELRSWIPVLLAYSGA